MANFRGWLEPLDTLAKPLDWTYFGRVRVPTESLLDSLERSAMATHSVIAEVGHLQDVRDRLVNSGIDISSMRNDDIVLSSLDMAIDRGETANASLLIARDLLSNAEGRSFSWMFGSILSRFDGQLSELEELERFASLSIEVFEINLDLAVEIEPVISILRDRPEELNQITELEEMVADLAAMSVRAEELSGSMERNLPDLLRGTEYEELVVELHTLDSVLASVSSGISVVMGILTGTIDNLSAESGSLLDDSNAISVLAAELLANKGSLQRAALDIESGINVLTDPEFDSVLVPDSILQILEENSSAIEQVSTVMIDAPEVIFDLVGGPGESRRYLVLGQTSDEIRPTGGFTSSAWVVEFIDGAMQPPQYISIVELDNIDDLGTTGAVPEPLVIHMDAGANYLRDVGWSPHFPDVAKRAIELAAIDDKDDLSGVIAINQWAFRTLVEGIGSIELAGSTITGEQTLGAIERGTDLEGTSYLREFYQALVDAMTGDRLKERLVPLSTSVMGALNEKDIMIYSATDTTQSFLETMGWTGTFFPQPHDYLYIVDSNVGWNKSDRNISRTFDYTVDLTDLDRPSAEVGLEYSNSSVQEERACGRQVPPEVTAGTYEFLKNRCYWDYLRLYVPTGSVLGGGTSLPLPAGAIAAKTGFMRIGVDTLEQSIDDSGEHFSGLFTVESGETVSLKVGYRLPSSVVSIDGDKFHYRLRLYSEPGIKARPGDVVIKLPAGAVLDELPEGAILSEENLLKFDVLLSSDFELDLSGSIAQ
jgi:hypothetical protein